MFQRTSTLQVKKNGSEISLIGNLISIKKLLTHRDKKNAKDDSDGNLSGVEDLSDHEGSLVAQRRHTGST